jgi:hypothetical protein
MTLPFHFLPRFCVDRPLKSFVCLLLFKGYLAVWFGSVSYAKGHSGFLGKEKTLDKFFLLKRPSKGYSVEQTA